MRIEWGATTFEALAEATSIGLMADQALCDMERGEEHLARMRLADFLGDARRGNEIAPVVSRDSVRQHRAKWWVDQALKQCPGLTFAAITENPVRGDFLLALSVLATREHDAIMVARGR